VTSTLSHAPTAPESAVPAAASGRGGAGPKAEPQDVLGTSWDAGKRGPAGAAAGEGRA